MDQSQLLDLAKQLLLLLSPLIAQGALAKIGEKTTDAMTRVLNRAWEALQRHLSSDTARSTLNVYQRLPQSQDVQALVAREIVAAVKDDQTAIAELQELVRLLREQVDSARSGSTHRIDIGDKAQVGQAIAGPVYGSVTVGPIDFSRKTISAASTTGATTPGSQMVRPPRNRIDDMTLSANGTHFSYGHALVIGVGDYQNAWLSTTTTATDAHALAQLLRDPQVAAYPTQQVRVLTDRAATRAGILAALDSFAQQLAAASYWDITPGSTALLFFAGHGKRHGDSYYLLPHDYTSDNVAGSAISAALFHEKVAAIREQTQKLIVLLNCCHAGGVGDDVLSDTATDSGDAPPSEFYRPLVAGGGQVVISSSRPWQKSGAASRVTMQHTVFGAHLLDALRGQAPGEAAGIGIFELFSYLSTHVPADARQIIYKSNPLQQEPLLYAHQLDQNFAIALRPGWQGGTLESGLADMIRELAVIEVELSGYAREADAPADRIRQRDALLARLADD